MNQEKLENQGNAESRNGSDAGKYIEEPGEVITSHYAIQFPADVLQPYRCFLAGQTGR